MTSKGGAVGYQADAVPTTLVPLADHVQGFQVTDKGPEWKKP